jgi:ABC-type nickel/cobalt efflux system permease component RcnA
MKTLKLLALGVLFVVSSSVQSQVSVNVNIGPRPVWAPVQGYATVDYYYIPEVNAYYDTHSSVFVYLNGNNWVRARQLPSYYNHYDLRKCHKVVLKGYRGNQPYSHYDNHKHHYKSSKGNDHDDHKKSKSNKNKGKH